MNPATLQQAPDNRRLRISLGLRLNQRKIGHIPQTKIRVTVFVQEIHRVLRLPFTCCFGFCIKQISYVRFWDKSQYPSRIDARHRVLQRKRCQLIIDIAVKDDDTRIALSRSPHHTPKIKSIQKIQSRPCQDQVPSPIILVIPEGGFSRLADAAVALQKLLTERSSPFRQAYNMVPKCQPQNGNAPVYEPAAERFNLCAFSRSVHPGKAD